jgi:hypothetical protein
VLSFQIEQGNTAPGILTRIKRLNIASVVGKIITFFLRNKLASKAKNSANNRQMNKRQIESSDQPDSKRSKTIPPGNPAQIGMRPNMMQPMRPLPRPPIRQLQVGARPPMRPMTPTTPSMRPMRPSGGSSDVQHRIAMAREQRKKAIEQEEINKQKELETSIFKADKDKQKGGLNVFYSD